MAVIKQLEGFCNKVWIKFELKLAVFSKGSKNLSFFIKIDMFLEKLWSFLKKAKGSNSAVESQWKSRVSQNVQNLFFLEVDGFLEKRPWTVLLNG